MLLGPLWLRLAIWLGGAPVTRMLKDGIQRLRFLRRTVARMVRRAEMCGGRSRSISRPASVSLLTKPEMGRIGRIAARMRNRRLLAERTAARVTMTMAPL